MTRARTRSAVAVTVATTLLSPLTADAGLDVTTRTRGEQESKGRMRTQGSLLRVDVEAPPSGGGHTSILFDAQNEVMRILRHQDETYFEFDRATSDALAARMTEAQRQMSEKLALMPPEQRAMIEKMMQERGVPLPKAGAVEAAPPLEVSATGTSETIDGVQCDNYRLTRGDREKGDVCVVPWERLSVKPSDVEGLRKLAQFQRKMVEAVSASIPGAEQPFELLDRTRGFPLRTRRLEEGKVSSETVFENLQQAEIDASVFAVPEGYSKQELMQP